MKKTDRLVTLRNIHAQTRTLLAPDELAYLEHEIATIERKRKDAMEKRISRMSHTDGAVLDSVNSTNRIITAVELQWAMPRLHGKSTQYVSASLGRLVKSGVIIRIAPNDSHIRAVGYINRAASAEFVGDTDA